MELQSNQWLSKLTVSPPRILLSSVPSPPFYDEIFLEILSWLPVKSLFRFRCVSKSWYSLTSDPYFKSMHLNRVKNRISSQKLLFEQYSDASLYTGSLSPDDVQLVKDIRRLDLPSNIEPGWRFNRIRCSCDGLFLLEIVSEKIDVARLLLWNPTTGESILLPDLVDEDGYCYGLGYDYTSDDYKVLRINVCFDDDRSHRILSLKSGSWRTVDDRNVSDSFVRERYCLAFVHGAFHWLGIVQERGCVVSFNISDEMYGEIPVPKIDCVISFDVDVVVSMLGEMLCVHRNDGITLELWVMRDYGIRESWMRLLTIPSNGDYSFIEPLYRFSNDEVLLCCETEWGRDVQRTFDVGSSAFTNRMWPLESDDIRVTNRKFSLYRKLDLSKIRSLNMLGDIKYGSTKIC